LPLPVHITQLLTCIFYFGHECFTINIFRKRQLNKNQTYGNIIYSLPVQKIWASFKIEFLFSKTGPHIATAACDGSTTAR